MKPRLERSDYSICLILSAFPDNTPAPTPGVGRETYPNPPKDSTKGTFEILEKRLQSGGKSKIFSPKRRPMVTGCRHPKVRIVSRQEETEFVECLECGEVFDSEEFRDMEIEESAETEDVSDDA
jgi:hypothetical protein